MGFVGATDINDNGTVVGNGFLRGKKRGFVLMPTVPTPGPSSLSKLIEVVGRVIGSQTVDGSGIVFLGGIPHLVGPWGPRVGHYALKSDIIVSLAVEEMATHISETESQVAIRRAALEAALTQIDEPLAKLQGRR